MLCKLWITLPLHSLLPVHTVRHNNNLSKAAVPEKKKNHNVSDWTTNFGSESVSFSPVMMDTVYIVLFFTYLYFSYLCFTEANEPWSPAGTKNESFSEEKLHQEAERNMKKRRYENTRCGSANRRTKAGVEFCSVYGAGLSHLSFSVNVLYSKSTLDAEGKQDLKLSTNMDTGTLNARLGTYGQDGKYKYMLS